VKYIFTNKKVLSAKNIYSLITSIAVPIFIAYHLHRSVTQYTSNRARNIFSVFIVDNIYYFVMKCLSARIMFKSSLS